MNYKLIVRQNELQSVIVRLEQQNALAVDMEMENNLHHYGLHLALVQIATASGDVFVIDPLSLSDLKPLGGLLTDRRHELILHNADFDRRTCYQLYGWILNRTFDTQIAAMFCGFKKPGLASLLEELFGIKTDKRFQRHDWLKRPLSDAALEYAAKDVNRLHALRDLLTARLIELKRLEWVKEEFDRAEKNLNGNSQQPIHFRVKYSQSLSPRQLAILKALVEYRMTMASALDMPAQFVIRDSILIELARHALQDETKIKAIRGLHPALYRKKGTEGLIGAVRSGMSAPEQIHPGWCGRRIFEPSAAGWDKRFKAMRQWRLNIAHELNLEPYLVIENEVLEWCARNPERHFPPSLADRIRRWQKQSIWPGFQTHFAVSQRL